MAVDEALLETARQGLRVNDVTLRDAQVSLTDGFDPKYDHAPLLVQLMHRVVRSDVIEISNDREPLRRFRVIVRLGIRWVRELKPRKRKARAGEPGPSDPDVLALIEATFIAEYDLVEEVPREALDEFAQYNATWHVWPYWREYVANQCARMNLSKVTMPMQRHVGGEPETGEKQQP